MWTPALRAGGRHYVRNRVERSKFCNNLGVKPHQCEKRALAGTGTLCSGVAGPPWGNR